MWPAVVGAGIAGVASLLGGGQAQKAARKESARNRAFQERMRNTQWQAGVEDMKAAGINPALAYQQGPAASPGGSMAGQEDIVTPAVSSAMQAKRLSADLKILSAQGKKASIEADNAADLRKVLWQIKADWAGEGKESTMGAMQILWALKEQMGKATQVGNLSRMSGAGANVAESLMGSLFTPGSQVVGKAGEGIGDLWRLLMKGAELRDRGAKAAYRGYTYPLRKARDYWKGRKR